MRRYGLKHFAVFSLALALPGFVHAVVISSTTVRQYKNPLLSNEIQYLTVIDTNSVQGGTNVTVVATSSGISISAVGGSGGGASTLAVGTGTAANFTNNITSPTAAICLLGSQFNDTTNGTTGFIALSVSSVTLQGNTFNGASQLLQLSASSLVPNSALDNSSVTKQGNVFNNASQLVQLDGSTKLPAVDASLVLRVSSLTTSGVTSGSYTNTNLTVNSQGIITVASNGSAGGGGNSFTLAVGTGTASSFTTNITSVTNGTEVISFLGSHFTSVANGTTNFVDAIAVWNQNTLQAGATSYPAYAYAGSSMSIEGPGIVKGILTIGASTNPVTGGIVMSGDMNITGFATTNVSTRVISVIQSTTTAADVPGTALKIVAGPGRDEQISNPGTGGPLLLAAGDAGAFQTGSAPGGFAQLAGGGAKSGSTKRNGGDVYVVGGALAGTSGTARNGNVYLAQTFDGTQQGNVYVSSSIANFDGNGGGITVSAVSHNNPQIKTATYVITSTDSVIIASNAVNTNITLTLPAASLKVELYIYKNDKSTQTCTVNAASGDTIMTTTNTFVMRAPGQLAHLIGDGSKNWIAVGGIPVVPAWIGYRDLSIAGAAWTLANNSFWMTYKVEAPCVVQKMAYNIGTSSNVGHCDFGIYDSNGQRLASTGSTLVSATGLITTATTANAYLYPGLYEFAIACDNTIVALRGVSGNPGIISTGQQSSNFPLGATITLPGTTNVNSWGVAGMVYGGVSQ